jgi:hypothetical protein
MMHIENATFRFGDYSFQVHRLQYEINHDPDPGPGVSGFTVGEAFVEFDLPVDLPHLCERVQCTRCGQGRMYALGRGVKAAAARWARHVCPRGTVAGRWIRHVPR